MWIHQELSQGSSRIKHLDEAGSIRIHHMYLHLDPPLESIKIQNWHLPGFIAGIHHWDQLGSTMCIIQDPPESTKIQLDPTQRSTRIKEDLWIPPDLGESYFQKNPLDFRNSPRSGGKWLWIFVFFSFFSVIKTSIPKTCVFMYSTYKNEILQVSIPFYP